MFHDAIKDVVQQVSPAMRFKTAFWDSATDPCLLAADYACWAIGRKWEHGDPTYTALLSGNVKSEFDVFRRERTLYY